MREKLYSLVCGIQEDEPVLLQPCSIKASIRYSAFTSAL